MPDSVSAPLGVPVTSDMERVGLQVELVGFRVELAAVEPPRLLPPMRKLAASPASAATGRYTPANTLTCAAALRASAPRL